MFKIKCSCIYIIECGEYYYIGKSVDVFSRFSSHYTSLKLNKHHSQKLQDKYNELGLQGLTFRVLEYVSITEYKKSSGLKGKQLKYQFNKLLLNKEKEWMSKYSINFSLNADNKYFS